MTSATLTHLNAEILTALEISGGYANGTKVSACRKLRDLG